MNRRFHRKSLPWIILAFAFPLLSGCDGYRQFRWDVNLNTTPPDARIEINIPDNQYGAAIEKLDAFAVTHRMKCVKCDSDSLYRAYRFYSVTLEANIDRDHQRLSVRVTEFGPWSESKAYVAIKNALMEALNDDYPRDAVRSIPDEYRRSVTFQRLLVVKLLD